MDLIPSAPDLRADGRPASRPAAGPQPGREGLPPGLRAERRASGSAVAGPGFHVWDADHEAALGWARELAGALPGRRFRGSRRRPTHRDREGEC